MYRVESNIESSSKNSIPVFFFSFLVFLCCADLFFAFRIHNYNFRLGQLFLLIAVTPIIYQWLTKGKAYLPAANFYKTIKNWLPFLTIYAFSAALSPYPIHSFLKLFWAIFNIGCTALLFLGSQQWPSLKKGVFYGVTAIAAFIWVEFILVYCFDASDWFNFLTTHTPETTPWFHNLLGFAQFTYNDQGFVIFRPNAFYYEPSYAGCALTLAFPLCLAVIFKKNVLPWTSIIVPTLMFSAVYITTSRSGMLGVSFGIFVSIVLCFLKKRINLLKTFIKILLVALFLFVSFGQFSGVQKYALFFVNVLSPNAVANRINDPHSSEGWRVANTTYGINSYKKNQLFGLFFGSGVPALAPVTQNGQDRSTNGLGQTCQSMWLEILIESGILGLLAFIFGLGKTLYDSINKNTDPDLSILIFVALIPHFLVSMNFTATFPRLDYWLFFFFAIRLALENQTQFSISNKNSKT